MSKTERIDVARLVSAGGDALAEALRHAGELLRSGELVAFPTETVYGLGANALDAAAVQRVFEAKGRPSDNPLIIHVADVAQVSQVAAEVPATARALMDAFWPGPLSVILPKLAGVPDATTGGLDTVALRQPDSSIARSLIEAAGVPLAAPSANRSGSPSPTTAQHVLDDLDGRIAAVIDGGPCRVGVESTVVDTTVQPARILRLGGVTVDQVMAVIDAEVSNDLDAQAHSPGLRYRHYAPATRLIVIEGVPDERRARLHSLHDEATSATGFLVTEECALVGNNVHVMGSAAKPTTIAHELYGALRALDSHGYDEVYVEAVDEQGLGRVIMDRLRRAAEATRATTEN